MLFYHNFPDIVYFRMYYLTIPYYMRLVTDVNIETKESRKKNNIHNIQLQYLGMDFYCFLLKCNDRLYKYHQVMFRRSKTSS